jgi:hypothetical protein
VAVLWQLCSLVYIHVPLSLGVSNALQSALFGHLASAHMAF